MSQTGGLRTPHVPRWVAVVVALGVSALAACGGDDGEDAARDELAAETTATGAETTTSSDGAAGAVGSAELTPQGTRLAIGETANLPIEYAGTEGVVAVSVDGIDAGTAEELAELQLEGGEDGDLYYVQLTVQNVGAPEDLGSYEPSSSALYATQQDGQPANPVAEFGTFPPCEGEDPSELAAGQSFTTCLIFLATSGVPVTSVEFAPDLDSDPIVWS